MKKIISIVLLVLIVSLFTAACGTGNEDTTASNGEDNSSAEGKTLTVNHDLGETDVPLNPETIVVFDFGILDALDNLGVEVASLPKSNIPDYLSKYSSDDYVNAGTLFEPDFETIYGLDPDLIIISGRTAEAYDDLNDIAPTIHLAIDTANYLDSFKGNMKLLGEIFSKEADVEEELAKIDEAVAQLNEKTASNGKTGLIVMANDGDMSAYGPGSRFGVIHNEFGVVPADDGIEVSNHGQNITFEYIAVQDPDYLFVIDRAAVVGGETPAKEMMDNDIMNETKVQKNDNIVYLNPFFWYVSSGGITSVNGMIEDINNGIE